MQNVWVYLTMQEAIREQGLSILLKGSKTVHMISIQSICERIDCSWSPIKEVLFSLLKDVICEKMPEFHACFEDFIAWLLVFLSNLLALWWRQISALDHVVQTNICVVPEYIYVWIWLRGVACLLDQSQVLLKHRWNGKANLFAEILEIALMLSVV